MRTHSLWHLIVAAALVAGCAPAAAAPAAAPAAPGAAPAPVHIENAPLAQAAPCTGGFVAHDLEHTTRSSGPATRLFDSNGSGLTINDLDGDGDLDIVLADLAGPATILWNEGGLRFRREPLPLPRRARAVAAVDVDGDGRLDLALTNGLAAPTVLRNRDGRTFDYWPLPGVDRPAYAMNWADLDADGDLDLVTGSYDATRIVESGPNMLFGARAGVNVYMQDEGGWRGSQLDGEAQALAIAVWDLNGDGRADIWVGNDFDLHDRFWRQTEAGFEPAPPFRRFPHSTMGIERGDANGDGRWDYLATDMKPYRRDVATVAQWLPLMETGYQQRTWDDPQRSENFLLVAQPQGGFANEGYTRRLDAAGWAWSGKFGDLDLDGDLDAYVVNGMIAEDLLDHLPRGELVEENQARRNDNGIFVAAPEWGLGSTRSGRGMSLADLDADGDLDIVVNNLNSAAQLFENRLCSDGAALLVSLRQAGTRNPFALGASAILHADTGALLRDQRALSGYLSGDPAQMHFGLPAGASAASLAITWPDGAVSDVQSLQAGRAYTITRLQTEERP